MGTLTDPGEALASIAATPELLVKFAGQTCAWSVEFDLYHGFGTRPNAMENLTAAAVVAQPFPDGEQTSRQIIQFDPQLNPSDGRSCVDSSSAWGGAPPAARASICRQIYHRIGRIS